MLVLCTISYRAIQMRCHDAPIHPLRVFPIFSALTIVFLGEKQKALESLNQALVLQRAAGDHYGEAITLSSLAEVHYSLSEQQRVRDLLEQALPLWHEL